MSYSTPGVASILDYGAAPGDDRATRLALQAAVDGGKPTVWVPAGYDWGIDRFVHLDRDRVRIEGEYGATLRVMPSTDLGIVVGVGRVQQGRPMDPAAIVSSSRWLDGSAQGRWALDLGGRYHVAQPAGTATLASPPRWGGPCLTLDLAADTTRTAPGATECLLGWSSGNPQPLAVWSRVGGLLCRFRDGSGKPYEFTIPAPPGFRRVSLQVRLDMGTVRAWVDRVQVAPLGWGDLGPGTGHVLAANAGAPFTIGSLADTAGPVADFYGDPCHAVVAAVRLADAPLYAEDGVGTPQRFRPDLAWDHTLNDNNLLFTAPPGVRAVLLVEDPATVAADRGVAILGLHDAWRCTGFGLCLDNDLLTGATMQWVKDAAVRGLAIHGQVAAGSLVALGGAIDFRMTDCRLEGGYRAVDSWDTSSAVYTTKVRGGSYGPAAGGRSAIRLSNGTADVADINLHPGDTEGIELDGMVATVARVDATFGGPDTIVRCVGSLAVDQLRVDYEDGQSPRRSVVDMTPWHGHPESCYLRWGQISSGPMGPAAVLVDLHDHPQGGAAIELAPGSVQLIGGPYPAVVRCATPNAWLRDPAREFLGVDPATPSWACVGPGRLNVPAAAR